MKHRGQYALPGGQKVKFSANCWFNLLEETGLQFDEFAKKLEDEYKKDSPNEIEVAKLLTELGYAAAKAYDQENGIEISYNKFNVREWMLSMDAESASGFLSAMTDSVHVPSKGK